jgi:hypothetical protein
MIREKIRQFIEQLIRSLRPNHGFYGTTERKNRYSLPLSFKE